MTDLTATTLARHNAVRAAASSRSARLIDLASSARGLAAALIFVACLSVPDSALRQKSFKGGMVVSNMLHRVISSR